MLMVTENNNRQSDTKEVLTNNQDKKHVLLCIRGQIPSTSPPGGLIFGGAILGGLYMRGLFSEFYDIIHNVFFLVAVRKCLKTF